MKTLRMIPAACYCIALLAGNALAQGSLTPPGAPAETMKTLEQVEPRIDLATVGGDASSEISIFDSGSYYLSANLEVTKLWGIFVGAEDVTLDLNGFKIVRTSGSGGYGIYLESFADRVTVRNGSIRGFDHGFWSVSEGCLLEKLTVSGCAVNGIFAAGRASRIIDCLALRNTGLGISTGSSSILTGCSAHHNEGEYGIFANTDAAIDNCTASWNTGAGIGAPHGSSIVGCVARGNDGEGIRASYGSSISGCVADYNALDGIYIISRNLVRDCVCENNGYEGVGSGIYAGGSDNRIEGNHAAGNDRGLVIVGSGNYVAGNTVRGNTNNYDFAAGNQLNLLLCEIPETLDRPCSVKLAGTLTCSLTDTNGIAVEANNVGIDLNGHTLVGAKGALTSHGIYCSSSYTNLSVQNGKVTGWGGSGIVLYNSGRVSGVQSSNNRNGFSLNAGSIITGCTASNNENNGIHAHTVCQVIDCMAYNNGGAGIYGFKSTRITGSVATDNGDNGFELFTNCGLADSVAANNTAAGILVDGTGNSFIKGCTVHGNGKGIFVPSPDNRIDGNTVTDNTADGIDVTFAGNIIIRNSASGNTPNYDIMAGNDVGTIQTSPVGAGAWDNFEF